MTREVLKMLIRPRSTRVSEVRSDAKMERLGFPALAAAGRHGRRNPGALDRI